MKREMPELVSLPRAQRRIPFEKQRPYSPSAQGFHDYFWGEMKNYRANYSLDGSPVKPEGQLFSMPKDFRLDIQTHAALTFIENHHDQPFYLHLAYYGPHTPLEATKKYLDRFPGPMPERRRYALAMISAIDDGVGEIMKKLRQLNLEKNTLVIFTSDNGAPLAMTKPDSPIGGDMADGGWDGSLNDPWLGEKAMLTEGGIRVPMIYSWAGTLPAGKVYDRPVSSLDIAATANEIAGLAPTASLDGVNLMPFLTGKNPAAPHERICWRFWTQAAIREGRWKYMSVGGNSAFLFDVESDACETKNLITENPARVAELRAKLGEWSDQFHPKGIPSNARNRNEEALYKYYFPNP